MGTPARCRILVQGGIDASWLDRLGGLELRERTGADGEKQTLLEGQIQDQAHLSGVLNLLYDLRLPLLQLDCFEAAGTDR